MFPFSFTIPVSTNPFTTEVGDYDELGGMPGGLYPDCEWDHGDSHTSRMRTRDDGLHNVIIPDITVNQEPNIGWAEHYPKSMSEPSLIMIVCAVVWRGYSRAHMIAPSDTPFSPSSSVVLG